MGLAREPPASCSGALLLSARVKHPSSHAARLPTLLAFISVITLQVLTSSVSTRWLFQRYSFFRSSPPNYSSKARVEFGISRVS